MRIRITDGTREVEIRSIAARPKTIEAVACRLLQVLAPDTDSEEPRPKPIGFAAQLDGVSLDSQAERAERYDDGRDHEDDEE